MKAGERYSLLSRARFVNIALAAAAVSAFVLQPLAPGASAQDPSPPNPVHARLVPPIAAAAPGDRVQLTIILEVDDGWHVYWNGRNDTGFPLVVEPLLPDGCVAGTPLWPAPERYVDESGTLDHVYHGNVAIFLPVTVSSQAAPGESLAVRCRVAYAVCNEICLLGEFEVAGAIAVVRPGDRAPRAVLAPIDAGIVAHSRERVPVAPRKASLPLAVRWEEDTLVIRSKGARALAFFPGAECAELADPIADGVTDGDRLRLRFEPRSEIMGGSASDPPRQVSGVLEIRPANGGKSRYVTLEVPRGASLNVCAAERR